MAKDKNWRHRWHMGPRWHRWHKGACAQVVAYGGGIGGIDDVYGASGVQVACKWCASGVQVVCKWCASGVHLVCKRCARGVQVVCKWCA
eukprot:3800585-Lingulodinium_polyedra.AAC.1